MTLLSVAPPRRRRYAMFAVLCAGSLMACGPEETSEQDEDVSSQGEGSTESAPEDESALAAAPDAGAGNRQVLQFHNSATRDGLYVDSTFTKAAASKLRRDTSFSASVSGPVYAQPLYFEGGPGGKDLLIVATEQNQVSAFDAKSGAVVWRKTLGTPARRSNLPCGNISTLGVTGTPVIDAASRTLVVAAMTLESGTPKHKIFALSLDDGSTRTGWPVDVGARARANNLTFNSSVQNQRGALVILNDTVYVPYGGHYGDCGNYHGWVVGVPLKNPSAVIAWATRAKAGGLWSPGGIASDGASLYVVTGNSMAPNGGIFTAPSTWGDGEAVLRLPPSLKFSAQEADYAAAMNWQALDRADSDVGGSGPMLFDVPNSMPSKLGIALGKDGSAYLLNALHLGGMGRWVASKKVSSEMIITAPAAYATPRGTFIAFKGSGAGCSSTQRKITALKVTPGSPPQVSVAWCAGPQGQGSPIVTSTGSGGENIVWYVAAEGDNKLRGFDGETGAVVFGGGGTSEQMQGVTRFQSPIVAKGRIFVASNSQVYAFKVGDGTTPPVDPGTPPVDPGNDACQQGYDSFGKGFMASYCTSCHGANAQSGGLRLDSWDAVTANPDNIISVAARSGLFARNTMPPTGSPRPTTAQRTQLRNWLNSCK